MTTPTSGYGLFESVASGSSSACISWVAATSDRGAVFRDPSRVQTWSCAQGFTEHVVADELGDVFVYGNGLFESHNRGRTWSRTSVSGAVMQLAPKGRSEWLVARMCRSNQSTTCPLTLDVSNDGGRRWQPDANQPRGASVLNGPSTLLTTMLLRVTPQVGYVFSGPGAQQRPYHSLAMWATADGGRTWQLRHYECAEGPFFGPIATASPHGDLFVICPGQGYTGYQDKSTSVSHNGGVTWSVGPRCSLGCPFVDGYAGSVAALSISIAFEAGERGSLEVTRNAGKSWAVSPGIGVVGDGPEQVTFESSSDGFFLTSNLPGPHPVDIWVTDNAGQSWVVKRSVLL